MQLEDPIDVLMKEHEEGLTYLEKLNSAARYIGTAGFSPEKFMEITDAIYYIGTELRAHNDREEKYLFPFLDRHGSASSGGMAEEHRELVKVVNRVRQCVEDIEEGRIYATTVKELLQAAGQLYQLMSNHIAKENQVLFPMARILLTPTEYDQVRTNIVGIA